MELMKWVSLLGIGLFAGGLAAIFTRKKRRQTATAKGEEALVKFEKSEKQARVIMPILIVVGICLMLVKCYADYQEALTPLPPDKALDRAIQSLPKSN